MENKFSFSKYNCLIINSNFPQSVLFFSTAKDILVGRSRSVVVVARPVEYSESELNAQTSFNINCST